ncbi:13389_t:CDS:2, partial [Racocetra persica]
MTEKNMKLPELISKNKEIKTILQELDNELKNSCQKSGCPPTCRQIPTLPQKSELIELGEKYPVYQEQLKSNELAIASEPLPIGTMPLVQYRNDIVDIKFYNPKSKATNKKILLHRLRPLNQASKKEQPKTPPQKIPPPLPPKTQPLSLRLTSRSAKVISQPTKKKAKKTSRSQGSTSQA